MINLKNMRYLALSEATTFLALLAATYIKYTADAPAGVEILGPIHGALFVAYVLMALAIRPRAGWSTPATLGVLLGAIVPLGGYVVDRWLARSSNPMKPA